MVDGDEVPVPAGGAGLKTVDAAGPITVTCGPARCTIDATVPAAAATLRLTSPHGARWSVTDATGGAWFADGVPAKWDADDRPFFHTDPGPVELRVPAGPLHVVAARGLEFARMEVDVAPAAGETVAVDYAPVRRFDPAAEGWYGADLHVHLNYSGDHVLEPADAVRMQRGEGLALMHLLAGNLGGALVYDQELLEATAGTDLRADGALVRSGLEFRNQLLGHVHGLGLTGVPELRYTGVEGTDHPWDWPPNSVACGQMRDLGAVTTYAHPVFAPVTTTPTTTCSARSAWSRRVSWWPTPRSASSTPSSSSPASTTAARSCSTTTCSRAGSGWRRRRAPTRSCRSPAGLLRRRTRRAGGGCTPSSATRH